MKASAGKKVLMLIENSTYPTDPRVRQEANTLFGAGYQVTVICQRDVNQPWRENVNGVFVFRYPSPPEARTVLGYGFEYIYSFIATWFISLFVWVVRDFDVIHAANPPDTAVFIALFYKPFGKRFIFDHHDLAPEIYLARSPNKGHSLIYRILIWMEKLSFRVADHVISTNQSYKNIAMQLGHVPEEHLTIVRNGPNLDQFKLVQSDPDLKKRGRIILGYIGVMGPQDGIDYLLRALHHLYISLLRNDFFCVIIGKGSALADLKAQAIELGLDKFVWFTDFIPDADVIRYLSTVDICVDPDPSNSFNDCCTMIKMMEYMALGKPIVAFDLPEHRITAGNAALYAHGNDEMDFARQIAILMDDPERREKMGQIGRERVEKELAWPYQAEHLLDAYQSVFAKRDQS